MVGFEEENENDSWKDIAFEEVISNIDVDKCGYALSDIRDLLNEKLKESRAVSVLSLFTTNNWERLINVPLFVSLSGPIR